MDKETLSNYGWVVICVLVLVVMIALATPFGEYVSDSVKNTTIGLFDTSKKAMDKTGVIDIENPLFGDTNVDTPLVFNHYYDYLDFENGSMLNIAFHSDGSAEVISNGEANNYAAGTFAYENEKIYLVADGEKIEFGTVSSDGKTINSLLGEIIYRTSPEYGALYYLDDDVDDMGLTFFEDGTCVFDYISSQILSYHSFGNVVLIPGLSENALVISDDKSTLSMSGATFEKTGAADVLIEGKVIYNKAKTKILGYSSFTDTEAVDIVIPNSVTEIGACAFNNRDGIKTVTIPATVTVIGPNAFTSTDSLTDIYYKGTEEQFRNMENYNHLINLGVTIHYNF